MIAALLGADEIGFSTAPLIVMGCTMMRKCHLNTCPVGIATQDPLLRKKFTGHPEHVINYMFLLAEEVRNHMASLGVRSFQELIGRTDLIRASEIGSAKARTLNLGLVLQNALHLRPGVNIIGGSASQDFQLEQRLDNHLIEMSREVLEGTKNSVDIEMDITNECRTFASTLSYHISMYVCYIYYFFPLEIKQLVDHRVASRGMPAGLHGLVVSKYTYKTGSGVKFQIILC